MSRMPKPVGVKTEDYKVSLYHHIDYLNERLKQLVAHVISAQRRTPELVGSYLQIFDATLDEYHRTDQLLKSLASVPPCSTTLRDPYEPKD